MSNYFKMILVNNEYITLNIKGLIFISLIIMISFVAYLIQRRISIRLTKKFTKWTLVIKNAFRLLVFLLLFMDVVLIFEILNIHLAQYMSITLFQSDNILVTPSRILFIVVIFIITFTLTIAIKSFFTGYFSQNDATSYASLNVFKLLKYFLWIITAFIAMNAIGLNLTFLMAGSAALLVGVGIGMQNIFNDVVSGFFLLFERNLKINDVVEVDGIVGRVTDIGMRTSRIITRDNIQVIVPNSKFIGDKVINWSYNDPITRFFLKVEVAYGSNTQIVKDILLDIASKHNLVLKEPAPRVFFRDFKDYSLHFDLAFWTSESLENEIIKSDLRFELNEKFKEQNIIIPFPQSDIRIIS